MSNHSVESEREEPEYWEEISWRNSEGRIVTIRAVDCPTNIAEVVEQLIEPLLRGIGFHESTIDSVFKDF